MPSKQIYTPNISIAIQYSHSAFAGKAHKLAGHLKIPFTSKSKQTDYTLNFNHDRLELVDNRPKAASPVYVDFASGKNAHRRRFGGGRNQSIAKAVGLHKEKSLFILDATAGLGRDSFVFASLGCKVILLERSPIIAALLQDGLERAALAEDVAPIVNNMHFIETNASFYLDKLAYENFPDVIYLDPMYPERKKSALSKKDMLITRNIVGDDNDIVDTFTLSLQRCKKRAVVKRPKHAAPLNEIPPNLQIKSKSTRYDIYFTNIDQESL